jgi:transposase
VVRNLGSTSDQKLNSLLHGNALHPNARGVTDALFQGSDFFDARDLVQVKYEMLRRVRKHAASVVEASTAFGLSRPTYYEAQAAFHRGGLRALLPQKRGPRRAHKISPAVVAFLNEAVRGDASLRGPDLARRVAERFKFKVHPRSIERALKRAGKLQGTPGASASIRRPQRR